MKDLMGTANFSDENGRAKSGLEKLSKRLSQDRQPSTRTSSETWVNWDNMGDYLGQPFNITKIPLSKLEQMRRDPMISFGLMFAKIPLIRAPWYIKSSDPRRAAFIDNALRNIYGRLILSYCNSFDFGYSAIVKRFEYAENIDWTYIDKSGETPEEKPVWTDKTIQPLVWRPFIALPPKRVMPHWSKKGDFAGIDYVPTSYGSTSTGGASFPFETNRGRAADIPVDWALWATNEKDSVFGSLWGYPRIGYAYRYWWSYWYKFGLADRAFEKWADPPVIVHHPTDDGLSGGAAVNYSDEALELAEKIRSGANVSLPSDAVMTVDDRALNMRQWEITQLQTEVNFDALEQTFQYLDIAKLRSVMVPEQALVEGPSGSSSRNVAQVYGDLFQESQAVVMQEIDDHINRFMIPQLLEANFGPGGPPCTKVTTGFDPQDIETMRTVIGGIVNKEGGSSSLPIDFREMLDRLGIPLISQAEHQKILDQKAEEIAKMQPPEVPAAKGSAGVSKTGLYYSNDDIINLSDEEKGIIGKFLNFFKSNKEENE
jgi:hypothetical protein